jgi:hypothetical protein
MTVGFSNASFLQFEVLVPGTAVEAVADAMIEAASQIYKAMDLGF